MLGRKHIYLPHAQTAIYDSKVKLFLKRGISHQLGRDAVVRFTSAPKIVISAPALVNSAPISGVSKWSGTFTRLRSCIVPAEITEPPKISSGQNHKYDGR
jgi:hypothetical protein